MERKDSRCLSKCCGCIEIRVGVILIALFGIGWACYEFSIYLDSDYSASYGVSVISIVVEIIAALLFVSSVAVLYAVYKSNKIIIFCYVIMCGTWAVLWVFVVISGSIYSFWQIILYCYFTYIVRKYYYILKNKDVDQALQPFNQPNQPNNHNIAAYNQPMPQFIAMQQPAPPQPVHQPMPQPMHQYLSSNNDIWNCSRCEFKQSKASILCQMCDLPNPYYRQQYNNMYQMLMPPVHQQNQRNQMHDDMWNCSRCTYQQKKSNVACEMCGFINQNQKYVENHQTALI